MQDESVAGTVGIDNEMLEMLRCYAASDQEEARLKAEHILSVLAPGVWEPPGRRAAKPSRKRSRSKIEPPPQPPVATCENEACPHVRLGIQHPASGQTPINFPTTCKALQDSKLRPCDNKHCWSVDEAAHCAWWHGADGPRVHGLDSLQLPPKDRTRSYVALFFALHATAYGRWERSFEYDEIGCLLSLGRQAACKACDDPEICAPSKVLMQCFEDLAIRVHHAALIENRMVANDPEGMAWHAREYLGISRGIAAKLAKLKADLGAIECWMRKLVEELEGQVEWSITHHEMLVRVAELFAARATDKEKFISDFPAVQGDLSATISRLEDEEDFESASEMRAHAECLARHMDAIDTPPLIMEKADVTFMFGFRCDIKSYVADAALRESVLDRVREHFNADRRMGEFEVILASEDRVPDILETSLGKRHFKSVLLKLPKITLRHLDGPGLPFLQGQEEIELEPTLIHFSMGVGCVYFNISVPRLTVSDFQRVKHLACPHSPACRIFFTPGQGDSAAGGTTPESGTWGRLHDLARDIVDAYDKEVCRRLNIARRGNKVRFWNEPERSWFVRSTFYRISRGEGEPLPITELFQHPEWPGIAAYPRSDRATIDDWIGIEYSALRLRNLGGILSHRNDVFLITGNHSLTYLPDDPEFIVLQYEDTAKWVFLVYTLVLSALDQSELTQTALWDKVTSRVCQERFKKDVLLGGDDADLLRECYKTSIELLPSFAAFRDALDHARSIGVSQYADHSLLLREAFETTTITAMLDVLQKKVTSGQASSQDLGVLIQRMKEANDSRRQKILVAFVGLLPIFEFVRQLTEHASDPLWWVLLITLPAIVFIMTRNFWFTLVDEIGAKRRKKSGKDDASFFPPVG